MTVFNTISPSASGIDISLLATFPMLASLNERERQQLARAAEFRTVRKHSFVYLPDEATEHVFLLVKGEIKTGIHLSDGREVIKSVIHANEIFGELGLTGETKRAEFASAMNSEITFLAIRVEDFKRLMASNFALAQKVMLSFGERLRRAERQWESLIVKDVRGRIVEFIRQSAEDRGRQVGYETLVKHSLTQADIAGIVGASRQTVTSVLNDLRKSNIIYFNRSSILIRDLAKLN